MTKKSLINYIENKHSVEIFEETATFSDNGGSYSLDCSVSFSFEPNYEDPSDWEYVNYKVTKQEVQEYEIEETAKLKKSETIAQIHRIGNLKGKDKALEFLASCGVTRGEHLLVSEQEKLDEILEKIKSI